MEIIVLGICKRTKRMACIVIVTIHVHKCEIAIMCLLVVELLVLPYNTLFLSYAILFLLFLAAFSLFLFVFFSRSWLQAIRNHHHLKFSFRQFSTYRTSGAKASQHDHGNRKTRRFFFLSSKRCAEDKSFE